MTIEIDLRIATGDPVRNDVFKNKKINSNKMSSSKSLTHDLFFVNVEFISALVTFFSCIAIQLTTERVAVEDGEAVGLPAGASREHALRRPGVQGVDGFHHSHHVAIKEVLVFMIFCDVCNTFVETSLVTLAFFFTQ